MKQKLLTILSLLVLCVTGAWGETENLSAAGTDKAAVVGTSFTTATNMMTKDTSGDYVKVRTGENSNTWTFTVNTGYKITGIRIVGYSNNTKETASIDMTSLKVNNVEKLDANKTFPANTSGKTDVNVNVTGFEITEGQQIVCTFDNSNIISGSTGEKNKQVMVKVTFTYEAASTKITPIASFDTSSFELDADNYDSFTEPTLSILDDEDNDISDAYNVSYASDNDAVASVTSAGIVTINQVVGTATITATITAKNEETHNSTTASYSITYSPVQAYKNDYSDFTVISGTNTAYMWIPKSVVDASSWIDANSATSGNQKQNIFIDPATGSQSTEDTKSDYYRPKDLSTSKHLTFYLTNITEVSFYAYNGSTNKKLTAKVGEGEEKVLATTDNDHKSLVGTISDLNPNTKYTIKVYNQNSSSGASEMYIGAIKVTLAKNNVTIGGAGLATYTPIVGLDFTDATNIKAYKASIDGNEVTFTKVNKVAAGEGILLRSMSEGAVNENITVDKDATVNDGNAFVPVTETINSLASTSDGYDNYILNKVDGVVGFYKAAGNKVAAGKAYLRVAAGTPAKISFDFMDETDGIKAVSTKVENGVRYNLAGQRVSNDYKGIVIVNGKKMLNK